MNIVKKIMVVKDTQNIVIRAKTGMVMSDKSMTGWFVGYIEKNGNVYYFANCIQASNIEIMDFIKARIEIPYRILNDLKITNEPL